MSRVQLAINVTDIDKAVAFYSRLFGTAPAKVKPGYANFAIADPPLKLVLFEGTEGATLNHLGGGGDGRRGRSGGTAAARGRPGNDRGRGYRLLPRREDRNLALRPRRHALGVVRQVGRRRPAPQDGRQQPVRRGVHDLLLVNGAALLGYS